MSGMEGETTQGANVGRWRLLLDLIRPDLSRWLGLGLFVAIGAGLNLVGPLIIGRIVDRSIAGVEVNEISRLALWFLVVAVIVQIMAVIGIQLSAVAAWKTTNQIRLDLVRHVLSLDHEFHRSHTPGELIQRVDGDVTAVSDFLSKVVPKVLAVLVIVSGTLLILTVTEWRLGLGMAVYLIAATVMTFRARGRSVDEAAKEMSLTAKMYGGIEEHLTASEDLRANGAADYVMHRFVEDSRGVLNGSVERERAFMKMWAQIQGTVSLGSIIALIVSGVLVSHGSLSLGTAFLLFQYTQLIAKPVEDVIDQLEIVQKANGAMTRVVELRQVRSGILDDGTTSPPSGAMAASFRDVSFGYDDEQPVLSHINLGIEAGHSVGIVGRTGSGKTTYSRLVLRITEATSGTICLGGVPISDIPLAELRQRVALIPQEVELFSGTIRENVTLFDPSPTDAAVTDALRSVGLESLAGTGSDEGIHRQLGSGGLGLSAGEAQLLALARVWLRQPDLIVLDEATARVDPQTEARIDQAVAALREGRTTLIIAHRLSTLETVDDIVVFDHGGVGEFGKREDLVREETSRFRQLLDLALEPTAATTPNQEESPMS